jgi:hypothetical protein
MKHNLVLRFWKKIYNNATKKPSLPTSFNLFDSEIKLKISKYQWLIELCPQLINEWVYGTNGDNQFMMLMKFNQDI